MNDEPYRFWAKVIKGVSRNDCWEWIGAKNSSGYGNFAISGKRDCPKTTPAHRFSYEQIVGAIPDGMHLDHLCRNRSCVNPQHLEPVTCGENLKRGRNKNFIAHKLRTCVRGHRVEGANAIIEKRSDGSERLRCRECSRIREKNRKR